MPRINYHESFKHGTADLSYAIYHSKLPEYIVSYPLHWHEEFEFVYMVEGCCEFGFNNKSIRVNRGDILVICPQVAHSIKQVGDNKAEFFNILFNAKSIISKTDTNSNLFEQYVEPFYTGQKQIQILHTPYTSFNDKATPYLKQLIDKRHQTYESCQLQVIGCIFELLQLINDHASISIDVTTKDKSLGFIKDAVFKVQNMYAQQLCVDYIAKSLNVSKSHFMKSFKKQMGISFIAYLIDYRLKMAALQLRTSKLKIFEICNNSGFNNESYFIRAFYKKYQMTPKEYQKRYQNKVSART